MQAQSSHGQISFEEVLKSYGKGFEKCRIMEDIIPRCFKTEQDLAKLTSNIYYCQGNADLSSLTKSLSEPIWDMIDRGGKRWRPVLCMLIAELYGKRKQQVYPIAALCEIVHNGTLMVDDIEDSSSVRRNKPCSHLLFGVDVSLNSANFMYFAPMNYLLHSSTFPADLHAQVTSIYLQEMINLHIGQGWDILWHNVGSLEEKYPSEADYLQMTAHKTGVLVRLASRMVCAWLRLSPTQSAVLTRFAQTLGVAFQIQDDLLNLQGEEFKKTKGYNGEDIHEGKLSLMVIHCLKFSDKKDRLIQILKAKATKTEQINEAIQIMRESDSLSYASDKMKQLVDDCWQNVDSKLPNNPSKGLLKELAYFGITRNR